MKQLEVLEYLKLNKWQKFLYNLKRFFCGIPHWFADKFKKLWGAIKKFGIAIYNNILDIGHTFKIGSWKTKVSFLIMGFGNLCFGQIMRGLLFLIFEVVFVLFMATEGGFWLSKFGSLGTIPPESIEDPETGIELVVEGADNSFKILLYGLLTILFIIAFIYTWRLNVKQCRINEEIHASGKRVKRDKDDLRSLIDDQFHKTLLALPMVGIMAFTVLPILFMILVAFTSYSKDFDGSNALFKWVQFKNFGYIIDFSDGQNVISLAFGEVLTWTLIWAVFATFTNYFLGMFVAMMINKKGIRFKKFWRTALVLTIAVPQFISLLYISNMFSKDGVINSFLMDLGLLKQNIDWFGDSDYYVAARILVILINIWVGIPYLMLITTGILMNIPQDLYESAKIDGANGWQQYTKITLPYMLFVTGPYLLTSFINNLNNFNVIFLLTGGRPLNSELTGTVTGAVGYTDILITWLFEMMNNQGAYYMAAVVGIMIFLVVSIISLVVYNLMPSTRNEEEFS